MKRPIKYYFKEAVFGTLFLLVGGHKGIRAILLYHAVEKNVFARQMSYLKNNFRFVLLRDLQKELSGNNTEENIVCCTFDDGRLNNYTTAVPILQELGLTATFFIISGLIGKHINETNGKSPMMNAQQIRELVSLGHEIGAHTVNHPVLTRIPLDEAREEIVHTKFSLEDLIGASVISFAYPKGAFDKEIRNIVSEAGFQYGVSTIEGLINSANLDWLVLPRVGIDEAVGRLQFMGKVSRALEFYETLRGRR